MKKLSSLTLSFILVLALYGCQGRESDHPVPASMKPIEQVQREHESQWLGLPGVIGVGISEQGGKSCLKVFTTDSSVHPSIPTEVEGYPIVIETAGAVRALKDKGDSGGP